MAIHDFQFNHADPQALVNQPKNPITEVEKVIDPGNPAAHDNRDPAYYDLRQFGDIDDRLETNFVEDIREVFEPGFRQFDQHLANYFSGIRVPVGAGLEKYRMASIIVSGSDKGAIYANQMLTSGRAKLPIISITRNSEEQDFKRFSPPHFEVARVYKNSLKRIEMKYRPVPYKINYTLDIWTEHKRDADYIQYSIQSRFNPLATVYVADDGITMPLEMFFTGSTNNTDLEVDAENKGEVVYQLNISVEGWLVLPSKIIPSILSRPISIAEGLGSGNNIDIGGEVYEVIRNRPIQQKDQS